MMKEVTVEQIEREVRRLDPHSTGSGFQTAVLMLAALQIGTGDVEALQRFTGFDQEFIETRATNLRRNGIWTADGKTDCAWFEKDGGIAFWCDVNVAEGLMERGSGESDDPA